MLMLLSTSSLLFWSQSAPHSFEALLHAMTLGAALLWSGGYAWTVRSRHHEKLSRIAMEDPLTAMLNRRALELHVDKLIARSKRVEKHFAVIFLDIDEFKRINDSYGHRIGDAVLVECASRFRQVVRDNDVIARMGGDEFIFVLDDIEEIHAVSTAAQRILEALERPVEAKGESINIHLSLGISLFPENGSSREELFHAADTAMYYIKEHGKNGYSYFNDAMNRENECNLDMDRSLREALKTGAFELYYQPKQTFDRGGVHEVEALIRWNRPGYGVVLPSEFIAHAERSGLIHELGAWVIESACRQIRLFADAGVSTVISINISASQLSHRNLQEDIERAVQKFGIRPQMLELEITEAALVKLTPSLTQRLHGLKAIGVRLAVDGFGSAYSSMGYMTRLPLDRIKIDRALINDILINPKNRELVSAMIALGHALNMSVVAEGIEASGLFEESKRLQADLVQGYFVSKPKRADALMAEFLEERAPCACSVKGADMLDLCPAHPVRAAQQVFKVAGEHIGFKVDARAAAVGVKEGFAHGDGNHGEAK
ncbi:MAG: EAL domain-containing protein [Campylobacterales bacterium]|nr:EAL domain-containing protein [Campylobacterales bacterium]